MSLCSDCLVPRRLSLDENVRAKEGGKETTGETSPAVCTLPMVPRGSSPVARLYLAKNEATEEEVHKVMLSGPKSNVAKEISGRGRRRSRGKGNQGVGDFRFIIFYNFLSCRTQSCRFI